MFKCSTPIFAAHIVLTLKFRFLDHLMTQVSIGEFYWLSGIFRNDTGWNNGAANQKIAAIFEVVSVEKVS